MVLPKPWATAPEAQPAGRPMEAQKAPVWSPREVLGPEGPLSQASDPTLSGGIWAAPVWSRCSYDWARLVEPLGRARQALGRLQMAEALLGPEAGRELFAQVIAREGVSTCALDGEELNAESMAATVGRRLGLAVPADSPEAPRAEGVASILFDALQNPAAPMSAERLCRWHRALLLEGEPEFGAGKLRPGPAQVAASAPYPLPAPSARLEEELDRFLAWFNDWEQCPDGLMRAGLAHLGFVTLHPFAGGNGRLARALADLALAQDRAAKPMARIPGLLSGRLLQVRPAYLAALQEAQSLDGSLELTPWLTWFLDQVAHASGLTERIILGALAKDNFWIRHRATSINDRQRKVLNRLLDPGPDGVQEQMTTRKYVSLTQCSAITASRDLADLAAAAMLLAHGAGRSKAYSIPWGDWWIQSDWRRGTCLP